MPDDSWTTHHKCGGRFRSIGEVSVGPGTVSEYRCEKCGLVCDATDSEEFEGHHQKPHRPI